MRVHLQTGGNCSVFSNNNKSFTVIVSYLHFIRDTSRRRSDRRGISADYRHHLVAVHFQKGMKPDDDVVGEHS